MKVSEVMTREVKIAAPDDSLQQAARLMKEADSGVLPVGENDQLIGMLTDRDIAVRAVAEGKGPDARVREVMTQEINYVFDDQSTAEAAQSMSNLQVRRLPVINRDKRLVGIVSLGDLAQESQTIDEAGVALSDVSKSGG